MNKEIRNIDLLVLSDVHLGTIGCHAEELLQYLQSVRPKRIILNGDFFDIWQFKKRYWPASHMQLMMYIANLMLSGVPIDYIVGNHDDLLRRFVGFKMGNFRLVNKLLLNLDGKKVWVFHGDVFDVTMKHSLWLAKLGAFGYDLLILINRFINFMAEKMGKEKISLSKKIKNSVKRAVQFVDDFEQTAIDIAIEKKYDYVLCGHIHKPVRRDISTKQGSVVYLNSGDWVENLTALEYTNGTWSIYEYHHDIRMKKSGEKKKQKNVETPNTAFHNNAELLDIHVAPDEEVLHHSSSNGHHNGQNGTVTIPSVKGTNNGSSVNTNGNGVNGMHHSFESPSSS